MKMKSLMFALTMLMVLFAFCDTETVTNVRGIQREDSKLVDIYYDLNATDYGTYTVGVEIEGRTIAVTASTFTGDVGDGVTPGTNRHIIWDAGADWPNKKGDVKAIVTTTKEDPTVSHGKVQLWEGGSYWADRNIGADNPWDDGLYFWWGDTIGYKRVDGVWVASDGSSSNFSFSSRNTPTYGKSCDTLTKEGWTTGSVLAPAHDAAHVQWGRGWRMPKKSELSGLNNKCDWTWTTMNGVNGYVIRGRGSFASNSIFLPYPSWGADYWSSVVIGDYWDNFSSWILCIESGHYMDNIGGARYAGHPIRPVQGGQ